MSVQRKAGVVTAFAILVLLLVQDVRNKVPAVETILQDLAGPAIERIPLDPGLSTALMVVAVAGGAATVAMLAGRRGPGLLAIMTAAILTWLTFPFARLSWLTLIIGSPVANATPGITTWLVTGALVLLAAFEAVASTRQRLLDDLRSRGGLRVDLVIAPAIIGAAMGAYLWWAARRGSVA